MTKTDEKKYFKRIGKDGLAFTLQKPFVDPANAGPLLANIGAVFSFFPQLPARIIDLGCGSGWTSNFYAKAGYDVLGVDISKDAIEAANKHFVSADKSLSFSYGDYDTLKHRDEFDVAIFFDSLHHTDDEQRALQAAYKALKPGGIIILCEPGKGHSKSPSSVEAVKKYGVSERDMPPKISTKALRTAGFKDIRTYAYPAHLHRANYKQFSGYRAFINNSFFRGIVAFALSTTRKRNHGLVVALK